MPAARPKTGEPSLSDRYNKAQNDKQYFVRINSSKGKGWCVVFCSTLITGMGRNMNQATFVDDLPTALKIRDRAKKTMPVVDFNFEIWSIDMQSMKLERLKL